VVVISGSMEILNNLFFKQKPPSNFCVSGRFLFAKGIFCATLNFDRGYLGTLELQFHSLTKCHL